MHYRTQIQFCMFPGAPNWDFTYELINSCRKIFYGSRCPKQLLLFCWKGFWVVFLIIKNKIISCCLHNVDSTSHRAQTNQEASRGKTVEKQNHFFNCPLRILSSLIVLIYKQERFFLISVGEEEEKTASKPEIHWWNAFSI